MPESSWTAPKTNVPNDASNAEDVATLYSWANLHGAKYRDFSASRAQAREEARLRVEEAIAEAKCRKEEEAERKRQEEAQLAARRAAEAAEAARRAEAERLAAIARQAETERQAVLAAQEAQRQAARQRLLQASALDQGTGSFESTPEGEARQMFAQAPLRPSPGTAAPVAPNREFGVPEFPAKLRKATSAQVYQPSLQRVQAQANGGHRALDGIPGPQAPSVRPVSAGAGQGPSDPAYRHAAAIPGHGAAPRQTEPYAAPQFDPFVQAPWGVPQPAPELRELPVRPAWLAEEQAAAPVPAPQAPVNSAYFVSNQYPQNSSGQYPLSPGQVGPDQVSPGQGRAFVQGFRESAGRDVVSAAGHAQAPSSAFVDDTLVGSRDRITNRWYALKSVFDPQAVSVEPAPVQPPARVPALAVFSLAGGVGKTSLIASLGRALSSRGERVLLVDTAPYGLLPFFFGARDQRPGMLRTFNPPVVSSDAPVQLVTLDPEGPAPGLAAAEVSTGRKDATQDEQQPVQDWLSQEVSRYSRSVNRVLVDLPSASGATTRRILRLAPTVVVPVLPDMNSVVSVGSIESFFRNNAGPENGKQIMPYYLLNQFDYSLPLHLDVREVLREQIGDRLLPFALRSSPAVSEALAEGMTVIDYAPNSIAAEDYSNLAGWVRSLSAPATQNYRGVRWSER